MDSHRAGCSSFRVLGWRSSLDDTDGAQRLLREGPKVRFLHGVEKTVAHSVSVR